MVAEVGGTAPSAQPRRWYVTSAYVGQALVGGELVTRPTAMMHAKELGTGTTACGLWSYSWRKLLDLPFPAPANAAPGVETCRDCLAKVIEEW